MCASVPRFGKWRLVYLFCFGINKKHTSLLFAIILTSDALIVTTNYFLDSLRIYNIFRAVLLYWFILNQVLKWGKQIFFDISWLVLTEEIATKINYTFSQTLFLVGGFTFVRYIKTWPGRRRWQFWEIVHSEPNTFIKEKFYIHFLQCYNSFFTF